MHVRDLLPIYALGCLDEREKALVAEHLATCAACRAELQAYQSVTDQLALVAPEAAPLPELKQRLMDRVRPPAKMSTSSELSMWDRLVARWHRAAPVWGLVSLALILLLVGTNLLLWQRTDQPTAEPGAMRTLALTGTDAAPHATATLVVSADGEYGSLTVDGLPALDETQQYHLWLFRDGEAVDAGVFSVNDEGYGVLFISAPEPLSNYESFSVTPEPGGGSSGPSGDQVLKGSL